MRIFAVGTQIFGGPGQHLGGLCPPGPNVEPPLRAMLRVCQRLASIVPNVERNIVLLVTSASDLWLRTNKFCKV